MPLRVYPRRPDNVLYCSLLPYINLGPYLSPPLFLQVYAHKKEILVMQKENAIHVSTCRHFDDAAGLLGKKRGESLGLKHDGCYDRTQFNNCAASGTVMQQNGDNCKMLFSPLKVNRRFGGTCRLHLQAWRISEAVLAICFTLVSCLTYSLTVKMAVTCSFEASVGFQRTTRLYMPENGSVHNLLRENLKSYRGAL
jgi:hypothetical protein